MAQPTYAVIDATVTKTEARFRGLAAKYVQWALDQAGATMVAPCDADYVLATIVSPHEYESLPRALKRHGVVPMRAQRLRQRVILGGQGALSPAIFDPYIDVACVGEGKNFLATLLNDGFEAAIARDNAWVPGETRPVIPDDDFPWDAPPTMAEDGVVRLYASRSCQKKCLFCHTGWATTYREHDDPQWLARSYATLVRAGYRVNVVTNDAPALSFFDDLTAMEHFSASYSQTREMIRYGIGSVAKKVKSIRFGVEAPSTRLRKIVGKPIASDDLLRLSTELLNAGVGVRWFMIAGLPGETDDDWQELRGIVVKARHVVTKGALQLSFTAFCPDPAAPLCLAPLDDGYYERFTAFWRWFFDGPGFTRKVQLFKCAAPDSRLRHAVGSMAATEEELRRGWLDRDPPNWRVCYPLLHTTRRAYDVYARRTGLPLSVSLDRAP